MPIIAIAQCRTLYDYEESVRRAGGDVRILRIGTDEPSDVVRSVDGILLTGGNDVQPSTYGEVAHATYVPAEPGRDEYELELVSLALDQDLPVLAICRGVQVLNVARGGTLIQHIPAEPWPGAVTGPNDQPARLNHSVEQPRAASAHEAWLVPNSRIAGLFGGGPHDDTCLVNSRHHQSVKRVGTGLVVSATAPDGIIEAIEDPSRRFCVGVQWHPENFYRTGEFRSLFEAFVAACSREETTA